MAKDKEKDEDEKNRKEGGDEEELASATDRAENMDADPETVDDSKDEDDEDEDDKPAKKKVSKKSKDADEDEDDDADEDDEDAEDSRLGASEGDDADDEGKPKRKSKGRSRRERRREAEQKLRTERDFFEKRNDQLERQMQMLARRMDASDKNNLDARLNHTKGLLEQADAVVAEATEKGKGKELVQAQRIRDNLKDDIRKLEDYKEKVERSAKNEDREPPDPRVVAYARDFRKKHDWFDDNGRDMDSKIVRAIDDALADEGYDPGTKRYWKELDKRMAKVLPHRLNKGRDEDDADDDEEEDEDERPQKKKKKKQERRRDTDEDDDDEDDGKPAKRKNGASGGPRFRTGGPTRKLGANEVYLSESRIAAMKEAGVWDDPEARQKMMKRYQKYDQENRRD